jgi:DNA-binding transcriptional MerR regulator
MSETLNPKQTAQFLGVTVATSSRWDREEKISPAFNTAGGHRRYTIQQIQQFKERK